MTTDPATVELPRADLVEALREGRVSATALTDVYLERIERLDGSIRSYVTVAADAARARAAEADLALQRGEPPGPLHGLPVALKDNIDTAGLRTTHGSRFFADNVPDRDAEVTRRLLEAGAVILGKAQLHEFAYGATTQNPHHGECRNPWDLTRLPGGSSGGSGAALAADLCAAALGTDTGGSVRIPAALNGVSGLRPTLGRVSNRGVFPAAPTFDTVGPMARSVSDVAHVFAVLAGYDPEDPGSVDRPGGEPEAGVEFGAEGLRIGLPKQFYFEDTDAEVAAAVLAAADAIAALGAGVEEVRLPGAAEAFDASILMVRAEALAVHRHRLETQPELFGEDVRRRLELGASITGADYAAYRATERVWRRSVEDALSGVDILLTPAASTVAPQAEGAEMIETTGRLARLTYGWSLAGVPALVVPCGFSPEGLPISLQLVGAPWDEANLFRLGGAYQRATDWHLRTPTLGAPASVG